MYHACVNMVGFPIKHKCRSIADTASLQDKHSTCGLVAMTSASHAEGRQFDPGQVYLLRSSAAKSFTGRRTACFLVCAGLMSLVKSIMSLADPYCIHFFFVFICILSCWIDSKWNDFNAIFVLLQNVHTRSRTWVVAATTRRPNH